MTGTRAISGSEAIMRKNFSIAFSESNNPSSILISIICAPFSICCLATDNASSYFSVKMRRLNFAEPATFVLSPTFTKLLLGKKVKGSKPLNWVYFGFVDIIRGEIFFTTFFMATICSGDVPQQPPTIFTIPDSANS